MGLKTGCCSPACADAMQEVSAECHHQIHKQACHLPQPEVAEYFFGINERCLGYRPSCRDFALGEQGTMLALGDVSG